MFLHLDDLNRNPNCTGDSLSGPPLIRKETEKTSIERAHSKEVTGTDPDGVSQPRLLLKD